MAKKKVATKKEYTPEERDQKIEVLARGQLKRLSTKEDTTIYDVLSYAKWTLFWASQVLSANSMKNGKQPDAEEIIDDLATFAKALAKLAKENKEATESVEILDTPAPKELPVKESEDGEQ